MNISIDMKRMEAIKRMQEMGVFPPAVQQFREGGHVSISMPPFGALFWAEGEDLERIRRFEAENDVLVYMVIRSYTRIGKIDHMLFVSDHPEDWEMDRIDLMDRHAMAFAYNFNAPCRSEMNMIGIARTIAAGLQMTWRLSGDFESINDLANQWHEYEKSLHLDGREKATRSETINGSAGMPQLRPSHRGLCGIKKDNYPLPEELRKFNYFYPDGTGHVVMAIPESLLPRATKSGNFDDYECPIPCRYILAKGYRFLEGYVVCDAPYDKDRGLDLDESWYDELA